MVIILYPPDGATDTTGSLGRALVICALPRYISVRYFRFPAYDTAVKYRGKKYIAQTKCKTFLRHFREKTGFLRLSKALKMDKPI